MYNKLPKQYFIEDNRTKRDFKTKTFNGYKKTSVFNDMRQNILSGNIEKALFWGAELHCSGYIEEIYKKLFDIYIREINKSNIHLLKNFIKEFNTLTLLKGTYKNVLDLRNNQYIRNHIHDLICLIIFSEKNKLLKLPILKSPDFNMNNNINKIITKNLNNINKFIKEDDHDNLIIPLSEILLNLKKKHLLKSLENCLFWLNWILIYEKNYHNNYIICTKRFVKDINNKWLYDFSWILWEIILSISNTEYIKILFELYKKDYTKSKKKKKINLIIFAFIIIIDPYPNINYNNNLIDNTKIIIKQKIISNINFQYLDISKNRTKNIPLKIDNTYVSKKSELSPFFSKNNFKLCSIEPIVKKFTKNKRLKKDHVKNVYQTTNLYRINEINKIITNERLPRK